jgi:hypothetical protein
MKLMGKSRNIHENPMISVEVYRFFDGKVIELLVDSPAGATFFFYRMPGMPTT